LNFLKEFGRSADDANVLRIRYLSSAFLTLIFLTATVLYVAGALQGGAQLVLIGALATALAALTAWQNFLGSRELTRLVDERTAELAHRTEEAVNARRFESTLLASLAEGVVACDAKGSYVYVNDAAMRIQGFDPLEIPLETFSATRRLVGNDGVTPIPPDEIPLRRCLRDGDLSDQQVKFVHRDGTVHDALYTARRIVGDDGSVMGAVLVYRDVTEMVSMHEQLRRERERLAHLAEHDELTGLYNRRVFERRLEEQVAMAERYGPTGALLMIDMDDLKHVNDAYGHPAGDAMILAVAKAMRARLRETDVLCRIGGDEFAVLLPRVDHVHAAMAAEALLRCVRASTVPVTGNVLRRPSVSIGVALTTDFDQPTTSDLKAAADAALYAAKRRGRDRIVVYHGSVARNHAA
jgi:diguanylate cyclase (GGDEF)-like protein